MLKSPKSYQRGESPKGVDYIAMVVLAAAETIALRDILVVAAGFLLMTSAAERLIEARDVSSNPHTANVDDPVVATVGQTPIRLSEAKLAHASLQGGKLSLSPTDVQDIADKEALAQMAIASGLADSQQVRAQLAETKREALASAYLQRAIREQVTEEALRTAYEDYRAKATGAEKVDLNRIVVASEAEAMSLRARISNGGDFDEIARRRSLDLETRNRGGALGVVALSSLPASVAHEISRLAIGEVSSPIKGEAGWQLYMVDMRQGVQVPPFSDMRDSLERRLVNAAIAQALKTARAEIPVTSYASRATGAGSLVLPSAASLTGTW